MKDLCGLLELFPNQGFIFAFKFSYLLNKNEKKVSTLLPSTLAACGFVHWRFFKVSLADLCAILFVKKSELHQ